MVDVLFNLTLALWGSYFVTLLFHLCTTVVTEKAKDQAALECLKSMAKCRIFIQEMKSTPEKIYPGRIQELKDLLYMVLNNRTIIIASAKPGLLPVIEACIPDYRELEKQLRIIDHGLPDLVDLSRLESMDRVHDMLLSQGQSSFAKTYPDTSFPEFADGKRLAKAYERLYADAEKFVRTPQGEKQPGPNKPLKMEGRHADGPRRNLEADRMSSKSPFKNQDALLDFYLIADALLHLSATLPEDCGGLSCLLRLLGERLESLTVAMDK